MRPVVLATLALLACLAAGATTPAAAPGPATRSASGSPKPAALPWLRTRGTDIVDASGKVVVLRGFNLGGALLIEPWLAGLDLNPGSTGLPPVKDDKGFWELLGKRFGPEKAADLHRAWRTAWVNDADMGRLADLGANVVRVPFWYLTVEDPKKPGELSADGAKMLDDVVDACAAHRVYAILDLQVPPAARARRTTPARPTATSSSATPTSRPAPPGCGRASPGGTGTARRWPGTTC